METIAHILSFCFPFFSWIRFTDTWGDYGDVVITYWLARDQQQNFRSVGFKWILWFMFSVFNQSICHFDFHNSMVGYKTINEWHYLPFAGKPRLSEDCNCHPKSRLWMQPWSSTTFWRRLLWRWTKPLNFCDEDQVGLLWIQATFWFFCVGDM